MHIRYGTQGPDGRRSEAERGAPPSLRVVTRACCGTAVAAIVATAALAASAAPSGSGATPVGQSAGRGPTLQLLAWPEPGRDGLDAYAGALPIAYRGTHRSACQQSQL